MAQRGDEEAAGSEWIGGPRQPGNIDSPRASTPFPSSHIRPFGGRSVDQSRPTRVPSRSWERLRVRAYSLLAPWRDGPAPYRDGIVRWIEGKVLADSRVDLVFDQSGSERRRCPRSSP